MAHLGVATDTYKDSEVRAILAPFSDMLGRVGAAGILIRHLTKSGSGKAILRGQGSIGFIGAARLAMMVGEHPLFEDHRVLAVQKSNIAKKASSLVYRLVPSAYDPEVARVEYTGYSPMTADDLVQAEQRGRNADKTQEAVTLLLDTLIHGPAPASDILAAAREADISERTLRAAKDLLSIESEKTGMNGGWMWSLPQTREGPPFCPDILQPSQNGSESQERTEVDPE